MRGLRRTVRDSQNDYGGAMARNSRERRGAGEQERADRYTEFDAAQNQQEEKHARKKHRQNRKKKRGIIGRIILVLLILLVLAAGGVAVIDWMDVSLPQDISEKVTIPGGIRDTAMRADQLADQLDYDGAIALVQNHMVYQYNTALQEREVRYKAAQGTMEQEIEGLLASAENSAAMDDFQGAADLLKDSIYYDHSEEMRQKAAEYEEIERGKAEAVAQAISSAELQAQMYDYDQAIEILKNTVGYQGNTELQDKAAQYEAAKAACVAFSPEQVTHIFYHSLVVDPSRAFRPEDEGYDGWQQWMTTVYEFDKITQSMYDRGYVLVSIHDLITKTTSEDGKVTISANQILLPEGKKPYVLSLDDLCYYHTYDDHGVASKLVLDEEGKPTCEYIQADGKVVYGDYDAVPRLDTFLEKHPDACYHGARGIVALTGYDGILGYRTDGAYSPEHNVNTDTYYADELQLKWLEAHPDYNWDEECAGARAVADAMKAEGWEFASHTWGHKAVGEITYEKLVKDTERWMQYVSPLIGGTDTIIFAHGADLSSTGAYDDSNEKYKYLKSQGFDIFCNVDSVAYTTTVTPDYLHQGRRNLDGYRIYQDCISESSLTSDLFDANEVIDPDRPLPVPDLNSGSGENEEEEDSGEDDEYEEYEE